MRKLTTYFKLRLLLIGVLLLISNQLLADGSKDLYPDGKIGYRAYLRSSTTPDAERWPFANDGSHYVYAKAGEKITMASSAQLATGPSVIKLYSPSGSLLLNNDTVAGQIPSRTAELAGPQLSGTPTGNRYAPIYYQVPAGGTGIYRVEFVARGTGSPATTILANSNWSQGSDAGIMAWDISVINTTDTAFIPGRVYANVLNLTNGTTNPVANGFHGIVYALTDDGFTYRINNNGNNGLWFTFFVNNNGFLDATGSPLYKSLNKTNLTNTDVQNPLNPDTATQVTHKMFYTLPASDLPTTSMGAVPGNTTWLKKSPIVPEVTNLTVQGVEGVGDQISVKGGYIRFNANRDSKYSIIIKSGDVPEAFPSRLLRGFAVSGNNSIFWDGKDGKGDFLPAGTEPAIIRVSLQGAEVHFPYIDMEYNKTGTIIELLNDSNLNTVISDIVYWDDTDIPNATNGDNSNPKNNSQLPPTNSAGISSNSNGHKWGEGGTGTANQFGDRKSMDTWAFVTGPIVTLDADIITKIADLKISQINVDKTTVVPGDNLSIIVKVKNDGPSDAEGAKFTFVLPVGFDPQSFVFDANGCGVEALALSYDPATRTYSSNLNLPNGCEITYTFDVLTSTTGTSGNIDFKADILRPNDVTDPDATNIDPAIPPTSAQFECANNGFGGVCNNIKIISILYSATAVCTEEVLGEDFTASGGTPKTFNQPATDYGFVFDIYQLDNSFNMTINGVQLSTSELEFQAESTPAPGINIRFADGTTYGTGGTTGTQKIWQMAGSEAAPLIRVVISPTGLVNMYGSKVSGGPLFPLELFNGNALNTITWNTAAVNVVTITQNVVDVTNITGRGYGLKIVPCACYNPANTIGLGTDTKVGITLLQRAGLDNQDQWPMVRKSGHIALESNTKGFVITRIAKANLGNITTPQEGMMVYDTTDKCLKLFADGVWACFSKPTCP